MLLGCQMLEKLFYKTMTFFNISGWEKHSDENGFYYWHIKSGTIQRDPPQWDDSDAEQKSRSGKS